MIDEWRTATIEEVTEKVGMGPFGSSIKVETFVDEGVPIISGQHLIGTRLFDAEHNYITIEHAERLKNANVYRGDVTPYDVYTGRHLEVIQRRKEAKPAKVRKLGYRRCHLLLEHSLYVIMYFIIIRWPGKLRFVGCGQS